MNYGKISESKLRIFSIKEHRMKHVFILNPAAGNGKSESYFLPRMIEAAKNQGIDYEIHRTVSTGDAERYVKRICQKNEKETFEQKELRFYSCGGDGTFHEVVNGAFGYTFAQVAMIPAGTGNDFPRNFPNSIYFRNIEKQILGKEKWIDSIKMTRENFIDNDQITTQYGINMFNIGLDCEVVDQVGKVKTYSFVSGLMAYGIGVAVVLAKKEPIDVEIMLDENETLIGQRMLIAIGNGKYCGSGFKALPLSSPSDGMMDVGIVNNTSRTKFISLLGKYRKGTHLNRKDTKDLVIYRKCKRMIVSSKSPLKICTDGEISIGNRFTFEIIPESVKFSVPQGCE